MNSNTRLRHKAAGMSALCLLALLTACQGRTKENMVPSGDTVEVVVDTAAGNDVPAGAPADTTTNTDY